MDGRWLVNSDTSVEELHSTLRILESRVGGMWSSEKSQDGMGGKVSKGIFDDQDGEKRSQQIQTDKDQRNEINV